MMDEHEPDPIEHTDRLDYAHAAEAATDAADADDFPEYRSPSCDHEYPSEWINLGAGDGVEVCGGCAIALHNMRITPNR